MMKVCKKSRWMACAAASLLLWPLGTRPLAEARSTQSTPADTQSGKSTEKPKTGGSGGTSGTTPTVPDKSDRPKTGGGAGTPGIAGDKADKMGSDKVASMDKVDYSSKKSTRLTGCLQAGTEAGTYELTNIKGKKSDASTSSSSSSAASSASSASASGSDRSVKLVADPGVDLSTFVGHEIEVSGNWSSSSGSTSASASASDTSSPYPPSHLVNRDFNATAVKLVSATCSVGTH